MTRFRRGPDQNWEGRTWRTSPALNAYMSEVEAAYPKGTGIDGTVASKPHDKASPNSDHRPYPHRGAGVVNACDAGEATENDGARIAEALRAKRDHRTRYVIHEGRIFYGAEHAKRNGRTPWKWYEYTGPNLHAGHVHHSVDRADQNDGRPWNLGLGGAAPAPTPPKPTPPKPAPTPPGRYDVKVSRQTIKKGDTGDHVEIAQALLARAGFAPANSFDKNHRPDGEFGTGCEAAVKAFQKARRLTADGVVGPATWTELEKP